MAFLEKRLKIEDRNEKTDKVHQKSTWTLFLEKKFGLNCVAVVANF